MSLQKKTKELVDHILPEIIEIRRDIHQHPELAFEEHRTSKMVGDWLEANGIEVRRYVAGTGIIGFLKGGTGNARTVALRADMDALPITENTGVSYVSTNHGKAHSCGHDGHTAVLMGAAKVLFSLRSQLKGNVKFIFQPAEEEGAGADKMCRDGALANPLVETIFALHSWPDLMVGEIGVRHGAMTSNSDLFEITVYGRGGHAAHPHRAIDPVVMAAKIVDTFQTIISRRISPFAPAVITIGKLQGGTAPNVIPDFVTMEGTVRTLNQEIREKIFDSMKKIVHSVAAMYDAPEPRIEFVMGCPATINDDRMADLVTTVGRQLLGENKVKILPEASMGAEDFSYYLENVPGALFRLGVSSEKSPAAPIHSSHFDFNDDAIRTGILMMTSIPIALLNGMSGP